MFSSNIIVIIYKLYFQNNSIFNIFDDIMYKIILYIINFILNIKNNCILHFCIYYIFSYIHMKYTSHAQSLW